MFNMENIGRNIAELRKEHNMTQLELAELFDVTIDQLLGENSEIIEIAVKGDIKAYFENNNVCSFGGKEWVKEYEKCGRSHVIESVNYS